MTASGIQMCALIVGLISGASFFGGLWWTVRAGTAVRHPAVWFPLSLALRGSLLGVGFYYVAADGWQALLLCTAGVLIARTAMLCLICPADFRPHAS
jgi:F1F0 ATPase subunit 2